ncbi:MAG: hypothetical protein RIQ79_1818 [Verrucomicrobiota bacterium]
MALSLHFFHKFPPPPMIATQRSAQLISWFWQEGCQRPNPPAGASNETDNREKYRLPVDSWVAPLHRLHDELRELEEARRPRPPALALWGGSQTGKSTALSFIDGDLVLSGQEGEDGRLGGLHWPGGAPFVYQLPPRQNAPAHWNTCAYNPFNTEDDGSACLTRIVAASTNPKDGLRVVEDPQHPAGLRLIRPAELLNTVARGYDTQCLGTRNAGRHKPWTADHLETLLIKEANKFQSSLKTASEVPDRVACERIFRLITTIESLYELKVETFNELAESPEALRQLLDRLLLQQEVFIKLPAAADAATALILWRGAAPISEEYRRLRAWHEQLLAAWGEKPVQTSLQAAMLFVDFGSGINPLKSDFTPGLRQRLQKELISALGWMERGGRIFIGSGPGYPKKLGTTPMEFAMTQALVWELILPVNVEHLPESPGKNLLKQVDILDFPGVGKDNLNETSRLNFQVSDQAGGRAPEGGKTPSFPSDFFGKILKRGKTASVVANYATRRNIDSFAILQALKSDTAPSAEMVGQILEGCATWARCTGYEAIPEGPALPLHFILTFWGQRVANFSASSSSNFRNAVSKHIESYGWVRTRATSWALNYHWFRDQQGQRISSVDMKHFTHGSDVYQTVTQEPEFLSVFGNPVSRLSFDAMLKEERGGLDYFLTELSNELGRIDSDARNQRLDTLYARQERALDALCAWPYLRPPQDERDDRIDTLVAFRRAILESSAPFGEAKVRGVAHALRELLGVDAEQLPPVDLDSEKLTPAFVDLAFNQWISQQTARYQAWRAGTATQGPDWSLLGVPNAESVSRVLQKLVECLGSPVYTDIADSLRRLRITIDGSASDYQRHHLRRYLAIEMVNWLCFAKTTRDDSTGYDFSDPEELSRAPARQTQAWKQAVSPWLDKHLAYLLANIARKPERPALPGDEALAGILPPVA